MQKERGSKKRETRPENFFRHLISLNASSGFSSKQPNDLKTHEFKQLLDSHLTRSSEERIRSVQVRESKAKLLGDRVIALKAC